MYSKAFIIIIIIIIISPTSLLSTASGLMAKNVRSICSGLSIDLSSKDLPAVDLLANLSATDVLCSQPSDRFSLLQHRSTDLKNRQTIAPSI